MQLWGKGNLTVCDIDNAVIGDGHPVGPVNQSRWSKRFRVSGVSPAAGLKSGQSNRKRNFGLVKFHMRFQLLYFLLLTPETKES